MSKTIEQLEAELAGAPDAETMLEVWAELYARQRGRHQPSENEARENEA